jgi:hypothetical protein
MSTATRSSVLTTLLSILLLTVWAALAVGVVLTVVFPERSLAMSAGNMSGATATR